MNSYSAEIKAEVAVENKQTKTVKSIYYTKYKTTGLFYIPGEYVFNIYPNDTVSLFTAYFNTHYYDLESVYDDRDDSVFIIRSHENGMIGEFRLKPLGKAELRFSGITILKLKI